MNKVILIGRLGKDAEVKWTPSGVSVTRFSLATSERWKDKQSGEWKEETEWHNVTQWRAEALAQHLTKGKAICVEGKIKTRSYEDKDGQKRYSTEIVAEKVEFVGDKQHSGDSGGIVSQPRSAQAKSTEITDDDLPF